MEKKLILIDGSSILSTSYYGLLPTSIKFAKTEEEKERHYKEILQTKDGIYTNAIFGMFKTLISLIRVEKPTHLAVAWDVGRATTFRRKFYSEYKATRGNTPEPLKKQFSLMDELLKEVGVTQFSDPLYEADDFLGSLADKFESDIPIYIMTKDQDMLQLASENTKIWLLQSSETKAQEIMTEYYQRDLCEMTSIPRSCIELSYPLVKEYYGVKPEEVPHLKGLMGDSSDNIPGVPGVGPKTAIPLINQFKTIDNLYESIKKIEKKDEPKAKKFFKEQLGISSPLGKLLKDGAEESARLSKMLATIKRNIDMDCSIDDLELNINKESLRNTFKRLEFKSLYGQI